MGQLSRMEQAFVKHYVRTNDATYSAQKAGYSQPLQRGSDKKNDADVQAAILVARQRLHSEGFAIGVGVLIELATAEKTPANVRRAAASDLVKYGKDEADGAAKDPHEMTGAELQEAIAKLTREASERARPVLELEANDDADSGVFG